MQINNTLSRWQLVPLVFAQDAVAASQTNVQLFTQQVHGAVANDTDGYCMPWAGEIVAISAHLTAAGTAGTFTIGPTIAGVEATDPSVTMGTSTDKSDTCPRGTNAFAANAVIGAEITTSAGWDGTSEDLVVTVWVVLKIDSI